jgi:uncharacterized protein (TIGR01440 family)
MSLLNEIRNAAADAAAELCEAAGLKPGQTVIVGCSSSEIAGRQIGTQSGAEIGKAVFDTLYQVFNEKGIYLAAQCCEHLNRAIIIERAASAGQWQEIVNAVPRPDAGGAFATAAFEALRDPVAIEEIRADAGLDIGGTLIGMHLKKVAVPLRLKTAYIGQAPVIAARTRPKLIGGARAGYDERIS